MTTTREDLLNFLNICQYTPVLASPDASQESQRRIQTDQMRLSKLPVKSIALYIKHGAECGTPERLEANRKFESEGFVSYRLLVPVMSRVFKDVWPHDE